MLALLVLVVMTWLSTIGGPRAITELDRAGVINEAKLQESFPQLAKNTR